MMKGEAPMFKKNKVSQDTALGIAAIIFMLILAVMSFIDSQISSKAKKKAD